MNLYDDVSRILKDINEDGSPTWGANRALFKSILASENNTGLDLFITSNTRLVAAASVKFIRRHPKAAYLLDDMFANGLYHLTLGTKTLLRQAQENPDLFWSTIGRDEDDGNFHVMTYLYIAAYRGIQREYELDAVEAISVRSLKKFTPEGRDKPITKVNVPEHMFDGEVDGGEILMTAMDTILGLCETAMERQVILLRLELSDEDIAEILGLHRTTVGRLRAKLLKKYNTEYPLYLV